LHWRRVATSPPISWTTGPKNRHLSGIYSDIGFIFPGDQHRAGSTNSL
jgi:hypothetical protein